MILLNPGPVGLSEGVRRALLSPDLCHREPEFFALQDGVRARLLDVYGLDPQRWAAVLLTGSGTSAVESMLASLVPADGHLLVLENGAYGERMSSIARVHGIRCVRLEADWGAELPLERVAEALAEHTDLTHVAVVHHETTTGRLNRLDELSALCRSAGAALLVDGVSSFAAEELDFDGWGLAACAATAGKCLHAVPGLAFVLARRDALARACRPPRSLYLDLALHHGEQDRHGTPFTPAVPAIHALSEALRELAEQGGWRARHSRYRTLAGRVARGLVELDVEPFLPAEDSSVVLRSYHLPRGLAYDRLHDALKERGFVIYAGQGDLAGELFRISTMGEIGDPDIARLLEAFREIVRGQERMVG